MKRHKPVWERHMAPTSRTLIDVTSNELKYDTWQKKKKREEREENTFIITYVSNNIYIYIYTFIFHTVAPSHGRPLWTRGNWWCNKHNEYVPSSIRGRPWEGDRMEWWTSESCSSSNPDKGWMSILVLGLNWNRPRLARPSLTKDRQAQPKTDEPAVVFLGLIYM